MGERNGYAPGTFCWTDLSTSDQAGAKEFYARLFGWEAEDLPVGDGMTYSMQRVDGKDVAAISQQQPQQRDAGVPPMWNSYVWVDSADQAGERAGTEHAGPMDIGIAKISIVADPQGAIFALYDGQLEQ